MRNALRYVLLIPFLCGNRIFATTLEKPFTVSGGLSPNGKLAIVTFGNINWNSAEADNASEQESHAYLYDVRHKKIIGPLEEVDVDGGTWGTTRDNVAADWSQNSRFLAVTFRGGRMIHGFVIYRIETTVRGFRAVPQKLPEVSSGPNGTAVFENWEMGPNSGDSVEKWLGPREISVVRYGQRPQKIDQPYSSWMNDQGQIRIVYECVDEKWRVERYEKLPDNY